jgi:transcriptional regulator with XRE-family HTH domain
MRLPMSEDINLGISIGEVVRAWREIQALTLGELVEKAGPLITKQYLSQLETKKIRSPGDEYLVCIAQALKIPVSYLVNRIMPEDVANGKAQTAGESSKDRIPPSTAYHTPLPIPPADILLHRIAALEKKLKQLGGALQGIQEVLQEATGELDELRTYAQELD